MTSNAFFNSFKSTSYLLYSYPIKVSLFERKMSVNKLTKLLKSKGFIYDFHLLCIVLRGKANNHFTLHYFTHIYNVLGLPLPTPEYLHTCYVKHKDIENFKKERRNTNRIKRGLEPI